MNEPPPSWAGAVIAVASMATSAGVLASARRRERRRRARLRDRDARDSASPSGPLEDRQIAPLRRGVSPWYESPGPRTGPPPTEPPDPVGEGPHPEGGREPGGSTTDD